MPQPGRRPAQLLRVRRAGCHNDNLDALLAMAERLEKLVQLDLSGHHEAFYACVEGDYCPYDTLSTMACKLHDGLRVLNLSDNGRKFAWGRLRREMRCINEGAADEGRVGVTIHYGDGVTEYAAGADDMDDVEGVGEDEDEGESMEGDVTRTTGEKGACIYLCGLWSIWAVRLRLCGRLGVEFMTGPGLVRALGWWGVNEGVKTVVRDPRRRRACCVLGHCADCGAVRRAVRTCVRLQVC